MVQAPTPGDIVTRLDLSSAALVAVLSSFASGRAPADEALSRELSTLSSAQLRAAYLECDRVTSQQSVGPAYMSLCDGIGSVLLRRDFGGDLQRQLEWWKGARAAARGGQEPVCCPAAEALMHAR